MRDQVEKYITLKKPDLSVGRYLTSLNIYIIHHFMDISRGLVTLYLLARFFFFLRGIRVPLGSRSKSRLICLSFLRCCLISSGYITVQINGALMYLHYHLIYYQYLFLQSLLSDTPSLL